MKSYRPLTLKQLTDAGACAGQVKLFRKRFGQSVNVTVKRAVAAADLFDWGWAADNLLSPQARAEYERQQAPLRAEYERQAALLWAEYKRQQAPLRAEYERQEAPLLAEYERQVALLWAEYERQVALLWAEYKRQVALLWARLYSEDAP